MIATTAASATWVTSALVVASTRLWGNTPPPLYRVNTDGSFLSPWTEYQEDGSPPCNFYNATYQYTGALCSHFALARMGQSIQHEALNRALSCAAYHETDCILSPEIGFAAPAAFVYDPENGLKMVIAPKPIGELDDAKSEERTVEFRDPDGRRHTQLQLKTEVAAEYLEGGKRHMSVETFNGTAAYCVQLLRIAFDQSCWSEID